MIGTGLELCAVSEDKQFEILETRVVVFLSPNLDMYLRERQGALLRPCLPAKWGRDLSDNCGSRPSFVQHWSDPRLNKRDHRLITGVQLRSCRTARI